MVGRLLCKVGLHRRVWSACSTLGASAAVVTVRARACARGCGDFEFTAVETRQGGTDGLTAHSLALLAARARRHPRLYRDPAGFPSGDLVGKISREVWNTLPDVLQWQLLAIDDCEAGRFGAGGLRVRLDAIINARALIYSFRARLDDGGDA